MIATNTNSWVTCPKPRAQARLRLFCFPYAGGGTSIFRTWLDDLPPSIQICSVQLPGRESRLREPCFTRLEPLVQALVQAFPPYLDMPYAFFGHSLGALIGFELAREIVTAFVNARFSNAERHQRRLRKVLDIEAEGK